MSSAPKKNASKKEPAQAEVACWPFASDEDKHYHNNEWGVPAHDDAHMFEHLCLECFQCGLSWNYVLQRREIFRSYFHGFDIDAVAAMTEADIERIMKVPNMLKSPRKMRAIINNAQRAQEVRAEFGSFAAYFWHWTEGNTIFYMGHQKGRVPAQNELSTAIAADLKRRGFKYVGPVNIYAHLQSCGLVCDHNERCPRYAFVRDNFPHVRKRPAGEK